MKKCILIFSGYNQRAVIALLRTLEAGEIEYGIIAANNNDPIFATAYSHRVVATRSERILRISDLLETIKQANAILGADSYVIAPSTEALNRFLLEHRGRFEQAGCIIPLVSKELYEAISDKYKFSELCRSNGIKIPGVIKNIDDGSLPLVAKPRSYFTETGETYSPVIIYNSEQRDAFKLSHNVNDFYFQEFVDGESQYFLYYFYKDGSVDKFSQRNLVQQAEGKSIVAAVPSMLHSTNESDEYETLLRASGYYGLVMVEVKGHKGKYCMIEANPRLWGPSQLFVDAGVDLFQSFLYDNGLLDHKPEFKAVDMNVKYFWLGGVMSNLIDSKKMTYHGYSEDDFSANLSLWMASDVYNREDTRGLFKQEVKL